MDTDRGLDFPLSNSFIIHHVKTKKIINVKEVSIDFDDFTSSFTLKLLFRLRRYIKHSRQCFIGFPNTSNFVKNTPLRVIFSTDFSVFGYIRFLSFFFFIVFGDTSTIVIFTIRIEIKFMYVCMYPYETRFLVFDILHLDRHLDR